jgi:TonB family protein
MVRLIPLLAVLLFITACKNTSEHKPDADRVIKDTLAQSIMRSFNEKPATPGIYVKVETKEDGFTAKQDAAIRSLMESMKNVPQHFTINTNVASEITGSHGTKLSFKPYIFVGKDGKEVSAPVDIELKECYSLTEMLCEDIINANGGKALESAGMICVNARYKGNELKLKDGEKIKVSFPLNNKADGYNFFYGSPDPTGAMNWVLTKNDQDEEQAQQSSVATKQFTKPEFSLHGLKFKDYLHESIYYPDEAKRNELSGKVEVNFYLNENGKVSEITTGEAYMVFRTEVTRVLKKMPDWKPATYAGKNIPSTIHVSIDFNIRRADQVHVEFNDAEVSVVNTPNSCYLSYGNNPVNLNPNNGCVRSFDKLGWINYGKPVQASTQKADLIVRDDSKSDVRVILKDKNSIITGEHFVGYSRFRNLPVNAEVYIVAVRTQGGNIFYAVQPLKLAKQNVISLDWKKGDEGMVQRVYKKLNG